MSSAKFDMLAMIRELQAKIDAAPPVPHTIMASHSVPVGRVYRQWDARGRLLVWANRGEIADLPRAPKPYDMIGVSTLAPPSTFGIPVMWA